MSSLKSIELKILPVIYGWRTSDPSGEISAFCLEFHCYGFQSAPIRIVSAPKPDLSEAKNLLDYFKLAISRIDIQQPLLVFIITTWRNAETAKFRFFMKISKRLLSTYHFSRCYAIIMDGGYGFSKWPAGWSWQNNEKMEKLTHLTANSVKAKELGAIFSYFNTDAPSAGSRRLADLILRIVGADLPDQIFPDYNDDDLQKISWHINRESFNSFSPKEGAIPKYPIVNNRPMFAF